VKRAIRSLPRMQIPALLGMTILCKVSLVHRSGPAFHHTSCWQVNGSRSEGTLNDRAQRFAFQPASSPTAALAWRLAPRPSTSPKAAPKRKRRFAGFGGAGTMGRCCGAWNATCRSCQVGTVSYSITHEYMCLDRFLKNTLV